MKKIFISLLISVIFLGVSLSTHAQEASNMTCPVMPGERVKEKFFVDYQGKRVFLCCRNCVNKFKSRPKKYTKLLKAE